jgi:hypothetical protein
VSGKFGKATPSALDIGHGDTRGEQSIGQKPTHVVFLVFFWFFLVFGALFAALPFALAVCNLLSHGL